MHDLDEVMRWALSESSASLLFATYGGIEHIKNETKWEGLTVRKVYRMLLKNGIYAPAQPK